ncbi:MAG: protein-export chaperone SecB [Sphingomonas paucimobilis]
MEDQNDATGIDAFANGDDSQPSVNVITQYVKDLSFENPNAPGVYQIAGSPKLDVQFNIGANMVGDGVHEVVLKMEARAEIEGQVMYLVDLSFAGLFGLRNIPDEHLQPFLLGEAPRILFPFARRVLADAVRDGGFPPLMLEPIDFAQLYIAQAEQQGGLGEVAGHA